MQIRPQVVMPFCAFCFFAVTGVVLDYYFRCILFHPSDGYLYYLAHVPAHLCFGIGMPLGVVAYLAVAEFGRSNRCLDFIVRHRFYTAAIVTLIWSVSNEILVYFIYNPAHGADWWHFIADMIGMAISYKIFTNIPRCGLDIKSGKVLA